MYCARSTGFKLLGHASQSALSDGSSYLMLVAPRHVWFGSKQEMVALVQRQSTGQHRFWGGFWNETIRSYTRSVAKKWLEASFEGNAVTSRHSPQWHALNDLDPSPMEVGRIRSARSTQRMLCNILVAAIALLGFFAPAVVIPLSKGTLTGPIVACGFFLVLLAAGLDFYFKLAWLEKRDFLILTDQQIFVFYADASNVLMVHKGEAVSFEKRGETIQIRTGSGSFAVSPKPGAVNRLEKSLARIITQVY